MNVFVTGGTGFIGRWIIKELIQTDHRVRVLVRPNSAHGTSHLPDAIEQVNGDILDSNLDKHLKGTDAIIHLVGIIREFPANGITFQKLHVEATENVIRAMQKAGMKRLVHMSALGTDRGDSEYFRSKLTAEKTVQSSSLDWTIIRPSAVYGPGDEFIKMLSTQIKLLPMLPVIGDGKYRLQPVHVNDVAKGFVKSLSMPETVGKVYEVGGPQELSYDELLDEIGLSQGKNKIRKIHLPLTVMQPSISVLQNFSFFPITTDQLKMLLMSNTCDQKPYMTAFGIEPTNFAQGISNNN